VLQARPARDGRAPPRGHREHRLRRGDDRAAQPRGVLASKGAVIALTRALAIDHVADGVRVNAVCPGTVDSPWVRRLVEEVGESLDALRARQPMGRLGAPEEIAEAVLYLAADGAGFVTGTTLTIDGGLTAA
jgi:NAD(P)-dependent dehydrogenase (short-subunit alcohol dehydrogenase family)